MIHGEWTMQWTPLFNLKRVTRQMLAGQKETQRKVLKRSYLEAHRRCEPKLVGCRNPDIKGRQKRGHRQSLDNSRNSKAECPRLCSRREQETSAVEEAGTGQIPGSVQPSEKLSHVSLLFLHFHKTSCSLGNLTSL